VRETVEREADETIQEISAGLNFCRPQGRVRILLVSLGGD
jgi:hypothetical protein